MLRPYRQLAGVPHLPLLLVWTLLGRLHAPGTLLALSFLVAGWTGSYAIAGLVGGALVVGLGIAGPLRGRVADRSPASRLLAITAVLYAAGLATVAVLPSLLPSGAWPVAVAVGFATGLVTPPVAQIGRAAFPRLATGDAREAAFTVEASLQELLYVVGPALTAAAVAFADARVAVWLCAALALLGTAGFLVALRRSGTDQPVARPEHEPRHRSLVRDPALVAALIVSSCLVASLIAVDVVLIAWARDQGRPGLAGVLAGVWAVGSVVGGLVAGGFTGTPNLTRRVLLTAIGVAALVPVLPPVLEPSPWLVGAVLLVSGATIAPAIATTTSRIGGLAPDGRAAEAFGWMVTATTAGSALAQPLSGALLDSVGPAAAAGAAALAGVGATLVALRVPPARTGVVTP
ncbi:MFS transporter [Umezawaea beigongshangensis]|uniref:MFS transporter n=1 Tax=Umezawaea beigongshangensis TaxID=2780383 RepID=UPI0027DCFC7F|nr:MFS transporter [Umezawaea beigongshangensis]